MRRIRLFLTGALAMGMAAACGVPAGCVQTEEETQAVYDANDEENDAAPLMKGEEFEGVLPVGSVVLLEESTKKLMILGYLQSMEGDSEQKIYDYCGCLFPEGYMSADQVYLFDHEQIEEIFFLGYQDQEEQEFASRVEEYMASADGAEAQ